MRQYCNSCFRCDTVQVDNESVALNLTKDQEVTVSYSDESFEGESSSTTEKTTSSIESVNTSVDCFERSTTVNKNRQVEEIQERQCERVSVDKQASDLEEKKVPCESPAEVSSLVDESSAEQLTGNVVEKRLSEQANLTAGEDGDHTSDPEEQSMFCGESTAGIQLKKKQSIWKFFDNDDDQDNALDNIRVHVPKNNKDQEQDDKSEEMSKSVDESQRPSEINDGDDKETEKRVTADGVLEGDKVSWSLSVSDDYDEKFEQQKEQFRSRIQQQLLELEKEHSLMLEELTQASNLVRYFERDDAIMEEEGFENLLNERDETLETNELVFNWNENQPELGKEKVQDPSKIASKVLVTRPQEERFNLTKIEGKLTEEDELNLIRQQKEENRDREGLRHQLMDNDTELNEDSLHDVGENSADKLKGELILIQKEFKETVSTSAQRNAELIKARGLLCKGDELLYEFRQSLTEMQQELEETKKALTAKDEALESVSAYANYEDSVLKKKLAKVVLDVKRVVKLQARLQSLLQEKDRNIKGKDIFIAQLKQDLKQFDTYVKENDNDIGAFKTTLMELKRNLELSRSSIREKGKTIEELESSTNVLKQELDIKNLSLTEKDDQIKQLEFSIAQNKKDLEQSSSSLKEKNNQIKDLDSSVEKLKEFVELTNISLNERSNELQQMKRYVEEKERELDISNGKSLLLLEENCCLKNESALMKTQLYQSEEQINDLKKVTLTKTSELREVNGELEKLRYLLQEKEQRIDFLQRSLASKERDNDILTDNMKKRFFEIRSLKGTLDEAKNERRKFSELFNLQTSYYETKIKRVNLEVDCKNILLGKKERALETAHLGIQAKEGQLDMLKERLFKQEMRFELYKKISTEAEYKLLQEKRTLEKSLKEMETGVCEKSNEKMEVKSFSNDRKSDPKAIEQQHSNESNQMEVNYSYNDEMEDKDVEEQAHLTAAESLAQMEANIAAMKKELKRSRENNATLSKSNKELKEKVNKLKKEAVDEEKRLNETLDKVHERDAEISRLNGLLQRLDQNMVSENDNEKRMEPARTKETEDTTKEPKVLEKTDDVSRESSGQNDDRQENAEPPDVVVDISMKCAVSLSQVPVDCTQEFHDSRLINEDGLQDEAEPVVLFDGKIQETIDAEAVESDDRRKDVADLQDSWDTTGEMSNLERRENIFQKLDNSAHPAKNDELHDIAEHEVLINDVIHDLPYVREAEGTSQDTNDVQMTDPVQDLVETRSRVSQVGDGMQDITEPEMLVNSLVKGVANPQVEGVSSQDRDDSKMTDHVQKVADFESLLPVDDPQGRDDLPLVR